MQGHVFISYARSDEGRIKPIVDALRNAGITPWVDTSGLQGGKEWRKAIETAIFQARAMVVFLSEAALREESYVRKELEIASAYLDQTHPEVRWLLPAYLERLELPNITVGNKNIQDIHVIDVSDTNLDSFGHLLRALSETLSLTGSLSRVDVSGEFALFEEDSAGHVHMTVDGAVVKPYWPKQHGGTFFIPPGKHVLRYESFSNGRGRVGASTTKSNPLEIDTVSNGTTKLVLRWPKRRGLLWLVTEGGFDFVLEELRP